MAANDNKLITLGGLTTYNGLIQLFVRQRIAASHTVKFLAVANDLDSAIAEILSGELDTADIHTGDIIIVTNGGSNSESNKRTLYICTTEKSENGTESASALKARFSPCVGDNHILDLIANNLPNNLMKYKGSVRDESLISDKSTGNVYIIDGMPCVYQTQSGLQVAVPLIDFAGSSVGVPLLTIIDNRINSNATSIAKWKGSVATVAALATKEGTAVVGDIWNVVENGRNYIYVGTTSGVGNGDTKAIEDENHYAVWDNLGGFNIAGNILTILGSVSAYNVLPQSASQGQIAYCQHDYNNHAPGWYIYNGSEWVTFTSYFQIPDTTASSLDIANIFA